MEGVELTEVGTLRHKRSGNRPINPSCKVNLTATSSYREAQVRCRAIGPNYSRGRTSPSMWLKGFQTVRAPVIVPSNEQFSTGVGELWLTHTLS